MVEGVRTPCETNICSGFRFDKPSERQLLKKKDGSINPGSVESPQLAGVCGFRPRGGAAFSRPKGNVIGGLRWIYHHHPSALALQGPQTWHLGLLIRHQEVVEGGEEEGSQCSMVGFEKGVSVLDVQDDHLS